MQFFQISAAVMAVFLTNSALGCKCYTNGAVDTARTESCCGQQGGVYSNGDCAASSISEHLSNFRSCCGGQSDCDFPGKREVSNKAVHTVVVRV